jgi:hypothetical protein
MTKEERERAVRRVHNVIFSQVVFFLVYYCEVDVTLSYLGNGDNPLDDGTRLQ